MVGLATLLALASALWPVGTTGAAVKLTFPFRLSGEETAQGVAMPLMLACYTGFQVLWAGAVLTRLRRADAESRASCDGSSTPCPCRCCCSRSASSCSGSPLIGLLALPLVPLAAGAAIVRYRLYDIDPVISKTLVVGAMVLLIFVGYVAVVVGVGALLPVEEPVLALAATATVAVAFEPVRRRAQVFADRLVYGARSTPYQTLSRLSAQLTRTTRACWTGCRDDRRRGRGVRGHDLGGDAERMEAVAGWPTGPGVGARCARGAGEGTPDLVRPLHHDGQVRGALVLCRPPGSPLSRAEAQLLADLVAQAGLVIDHRARLQQVARQADELQAAARRIVTAESLARRKIERDLHDGAQQRLVSLGMELGALIEHAASAGHADVVRRAEDARGQLLDATAELREMARGIHPSALTQDGLEAALATIADRSPVPVRLQVALGRRLPPRSRRPATSWSARRSRTPPGTRRLRSSTSSCRCPRVTSRSRSAMTVWEERVLRGAAGCRGSPTDCPHLARVSRSRVHQGAGPRSGRSWHASDPRRRLGAAA